MSNPGYIAIKEFCVNSPKTDPKGIFLMAHGAGKGMASPFLEAIANGVVDAGVRVVRFHFPYMEDMLRTGIQKKPNGGRILRQTFAELIEHCVEHEKMSRNKIIIGGKSMGARVASMIADEQKVAGVICLSYPFHPPKKPERIRIDHLLNIQTPTLICQGDRNPNGKRKSLEELRLSKSIQFHWLEDGDNNFKPRKKSGRTLDDNMTEAIISCNAFIKGLLE
ncbi:MAG: putative alpha/beta-hydrolase family hydrolase [Gammaproteobacteria bacterium]|jgi:predicted alpha/beta-hydrolase family hydrolase